MNRKLNLAIIVMIAQILVVGTFASTGSETTLVRACQCCTDHSAIKKKGKDNNTERAGHECSCCNKDSCPIKKKDGSESAGAMSCEKCDCCKAKTKDDHAVTHGSGSAMDVKLQDGAKSCNCPCCSTKDTTKSKGHEVITLALMNY